MSRETQRWVSRMIPLPKEMTVEGSANLKAADVRVVCDAGDDPAVKTAVTSLSRFALGGEAATFTIRLVLADPAAKEIDQRSLRRLRIAPNADQAYAIRPSQDANGLMLVANTPVGLLYAARTLEQLVDAPKDAKPDTPLEIPLATVTDWPDIAERGQWGGDAWRHLDEFSQMKLNVLESDAGVGIDKDGKPQARISRELIEKGTALGVKIVPYLPHLEQISGYAGVSKRTDVLSKPDPSKPLPSDYTPGLCMSSPATRELIRDWLDAVAGIHGVTDITVWLSEDRAPCFCEKCAGREPYEIEVEAVVEAFGRIQAAHPNARLRLLTTQGSYPVNDRVVAATPPEVGVIYYDGSRTYDSSKKAMIYPLLEDAARSGRWIGVYPQITHSWRTVFPWTAPQFIKYRADEFASKKLSNVIGYAVPSNFHHAFNVAALAEWTWNSKGRSPEEFARVYAAKAGMPDPDLFSRWAISAGEAGWALADSRLMLSAIYNPRFELGGGAAFAERFGNASISNDAELEKAIKLAQDALVLARRSQVADMTSESECALAGIKAFEALKRLSPLVASRPDQSHDYASGQTASRSIVVGWLEVLDESALTIRSRVLEWGEGVLARSGDKTVPGRLCDTAYALLRTTDAYRKRGVELGIADPHPENRLREVGRWSAEDFASGPDATISIDISSHVPAGGGRYQVGFDFIDSAYGTDVRAVSVVRKDGASETMLATSPDPACRVSRYETWHEMRIDIPARESNAPLLLKVELSGLPTDAPADRRSCAGSVGLRRVH